MKDISDEVTTKHKAAALGCYYNEIWHQGVLVGTMGYNGVHLFARHNYLFTEEPTDVDGEPATMIRWWQLNEVEPQVPPEYLQP